MVLAVPDVVHRKAERAGAHAWLRGLPDLVASLEADWSITVGAAYPNATEAYVARATTAAGVPAVVKVLIPRDDVAAVGHEIRALQLAAGDGCVQLLQHDEARGALLLERLGRSMFELQLPIQQRHAILCDLAARVWRPAADSGLPTGADKGRWLAEFIPRTWDSIGRPCPVRTVDHALACAERRIAAHDDERARLVHGDVHQWNALQRDSGFALVDPDGLLAEPEYDLGILMREDPVELMQHGPRERAQWLANRTGCDAQAVWEWGVVERLSTALLAISVGLQPVGDDMLRAAVAISAAQ